MKEQDAKKTSKKTRRASVRRGPAKRGVREEKFLAEYINNGGNGTQAVLKSGITDNPSSAAVIANRLLRNVKVQQRINEWSESGQADQREALGRLSQIARSSHEDFIRIDDNGHPLHDFKGAYEGGAFSNLKKLVTAVTTRTDEDGALEEVTRTEIELQSPIEAIKTMSKILGWEKKPQENPAEAALVLSYLTKAAELQTGLFVRHGRHVSLGEVLRAMLDARPDLARDEAVLRKFKCLPEGDVSHTQPGNSGVSQ